MKKMQRLAGLIVLCILMVQSSYGSDNYEFCDDNLLRTEKLILAQQKICTYSVDSNSELSSDQLSDLTLQQVRFKSPKFASLQVSRCCNDNLLCKDLKILQSLCSYRGRNED